jgi:hypothetical protein
MIFIFIFPQFPNWTDQHASPNEIRTLDNLLFRLLSNKYEKTLMESSVLNIGQTIKDMFK